MSQVIVSMDPETVEYLKGSGYILYVFKAVRCSNRACRPLVWFRVDDYGLNVEIEWSEKYEAYVSTSPIRAGKRIFVGSARPILLNQTLEVYPLGKLDVRAIGSPAEIWIHNQSDQRYTTGISQYHGEEARPLCAVPLAKTEKQEIAPLPEVLLMFSTDDLPPGTVIGDAGGLPGALAHSHLAKSSLGGVLIDLQGAPGGQREVTFHIDQGWSAGNAPWARRISASANLVECLVQQAG